MRLFQFNEKTMQDRAFTLIELLIVVAIIAILAAIAVPNFLEAQVRAKISRTKADLRTIATGLETYYVDYNQYPYASAINTSGTLEQINNEMAPTHKFLSSMITTPVSYLNGIPQDVFATGFDRYELRHFFYAPLALEKRRQGVDGFPADNLYWPGPPNHTDPNTTATLGAFELRLQYLGMWTMWGCGPDLDRTDLSPSKIGGPLSTNWHLGFYDPTNGTVSNGDVFRSQKHVNLGY